LPDLELVAVKHLTQPGDQGHPVGLDEKTCKPLAKVQARSGSQRIAPGAAEDGFWRSAAERWVDERRCRWLGFLLCNTALTIPASPAFRPRKKQQALLATSSQPQKPPLPLFSLFFFF